VDDPNVWSTARLPDGDGRAAGVTVNGFELSCEIPLDTVPEPSGATPFGLLAGSLSACTAMSVRTFLQRWRIEPGEVTVDVAFRPGSPPMMDRRVSVEAEVEPDLREQLAIEVDHTPVTVLLRDALAVRTVLTTGVRPAGAAPQVPG
jgi:putative redox protein